ncbi:MAG: archaellin/type IV pilin N-terminal domain-containing protein [Halobacteriota archaeon]|uniref:archaellin/type IV pilin N-terminal domain-containing protein n=1 Tax=Natronomonas sp. TaxID=2184060 RepID=UPI00397540D4
MFEENTKEERGQVGIGTLIVFIALVLVAAIAAGVLINTAGFLQSQAEQTGEESTAQVSNNLQLVSASGTATVDGSGAGVTSPELTVQLAPGSDPIDLEDATVEIFPEGSSSFEAVDGSGASWSSTELSEGTETSTLSGFTDSDFGDFGDGPTDGIPQGNDVEVVITTADGSQTTEIISPPDPITDSDDGGDVRL